MHAAFDELINFVEIEQAWMLVICSEDERKKYNAPRYRIGLWRNPEAGIAYLEWAAGLKNDEDWLDKNDPSFGQPTFHALAAQETLVLYKWWKNERPKRLDPGEASGWYKYCEQMRQTAGDDDTMLSIFHRDEKSDNIVSRYRMIEKEQEEEDTAMLIRLVKMRQSLWT